MPLTTERFEGLVQLTVGIEKTCLGLHVPGRFSLGDLRVVEVHLLLETIGLKVSEEVVNCLRNPVTVFEFIGIWTTICV